MENTDVTTDEISEHMGENKPEPVKPADPKQDIQLRVLEERAHLANTQPTDVFNPIVYQQLKQVAADMINSKAMPRSIENPLQALMIMQAGMEMGLKPIQSVNSLYIVNGQINIWGKAVIARLTNAGYRIKYTDSEDKCQVEVVNARDANEKYFETVTFEEAELSGYTKDRSGSLKTGWIKGMNRRLKLRYQALSLILKTYLPHLLGSTAGIVEVNEDWDMGKHEIEVGGKVLPKPGRAVDVPHPPKSGIAEQIMENVGGENGKAESN